MKEAAVVRTGLPPKYFIAHNAKLIKTIERDTQENKRLDNKERQDHEAQITKDKGKLPKYLQKYKK